MKKLRVESTKHLGLFFDYNMRWSEHIQHLMKKTKYLIYIFHKISKFMQTKTRKVAYSALFHSELNYGIIAWRGAYPNNLQSILKRIIAGSSGSFKDSM